MREWERIYEEEDLEDQLDENTEVLKIIQQLEIAYELNQELINKKSKP